MTLAQITLIAILTLVRAPAVDITDHREQHRLVTLSEDIALAAELHDGAPFHGPARKEALALALVSIALHESAFSWRVATCRVTGDRMPWQREWEGPSITVWQLRAGKAWDGLTRRQLCTNQALAAYNAVKVLRLYATSGTPGGFFRGYASGNSGMPTKAARRRCATWERLALDAGLTGAQCWRRGQISSSTPAAALRTPYSAPSRTSGDG